MAAQLSAFVRIGPGSRAESLFVLRLQGLAPLVTSNSIDKAPSWVKNGGSKQFEPNGELYGGKVKTARTVRLFGVLALVSAGLLVAGCKSAPELTASQAQALIQAHYDAMPAVGTDIVVDDLGMRMGVTAKYWEGLKKYSNGYWVDLKLTDAGKQVLKLANGGNVIEWRPDSPTDKSFKLIVTTVATNHLKARDVNDPQNEVGGTRSTVFTEAQSLDGVPGPLQDIAHNPGNKLSTKRTATFAVDNGAWKLQSVN